MKKTASEQDARVCCVAVNERGQAALEAVAQIYSKLLGDMLAALGETERHRARLSIHALARTLEN